MPSKKYTREEGYFEEDLLQSSLHHFDAACALFEKSPAFYDSAGYLLQLSLELLLKSWLLSLTGDFPSTHELQDLHQRVSKVANAQKLTKVQNKTIELLNKLYELRYPNRANQTEIGTEHLTLARDLYKALHDQLPGELTEKWSKLSPVEKGGRVLMKRLASIPVDIELYMPTKKAATPAKKRAAPAAVKAIKPKGE